tara:strand:+ start:210 stop:644 length:435 start_codon:yes stop_codon:yes gene_type:complete
MTDFTNTISDIRKNEYYSKLINILVLNGLLDIIHDEFNDGKIDYLPFILNIMTFLHSNKKLMNNFTSDSLEKIIILSVDEILTKKFNAKLDEKQLDLAIQLLKNTQMYKTLYKRVKDLLLRLYYKTKSLNCYKKPVIVLAPNSI